jgi:tocopherol O-methyltransferase
VNALQDGAFDAAYAIESSEHMADKAGFFRQAFRVLCPGGRFVICAWLSREGPSRWEVRHLLEPICRGVPGGQYRALAEGTGFQVLGAQDVSVRVSRTWAICARRLASRVATSAKYRGFLLSSGSRNRVFALILGRLIIAYRIGAMRCGIMTLAKP